MHGRRSQRLGGCCQAFWKSRPSLRRQRAASAILGDPRPCWACTSRQPRVLAPPQSQPVITALHDLPCSTRLLSASSENSCCSVRVLPATPQSISQKRHRSSRCWRAGDIVATMSNWPGDATGNWLAEKVRKLEPDTARCSPGRTGDSLNRHGGASQATRGGSRASSLAARPSEAACNAGWSTPTARPTTLRT